MKYNLKGTKSQIDESNSWIAPSADIIGAVKIGQSSSVWWQAVLRADNEPITIGMRTNIQDGCILHTDPGFPISIGSNVSVGHLCLIGIGSVILNGAKIGKNVLIGAHTLITEGKQIPDNSLVIGSPGKVIRELTKEQIKGLSANADGYVERTKLYRSHLKPA